MKHIKFNNIYSVFHQHFATDHYEYGHTLVEADSPQEAMDKLNAYLATNPHGGYTALLCRSVEDVKPATISILI